MIFEFLFSIFDLGVVAGSFYGLGDVGEWGGAFDLGGVGGEVDGEVGDAGEGAEGFFDTSGAAFGSACRGFGGWAYADSG